MLWQRVATAAIGIPLLLVLIYLGGWFLGAAVLLLSLVGMRELFRLAVASSLRPVSWIGYAATVAIIAATTVESVTFAREGVLAEAALSQRLVFVFVLTVVALLMQQVLAFPPPLALANAGATLLGVAYVPLLLSYLLRLRAISLEPTWLAGTRVTIQSGACWLALVIAACWAMDTAAYAIGKLFGRRKLCPAISPGKTVEGASAALAAAVVLSAGLGMWFGLALPYGAVLGAIIGVGGQVGDLAKSVLKRQAGVKDSGAILPGHGGVLDRFDSLLFAAPLAYYYLALFVR